MLATRLHIEMLTNDTHSLLLVVELNYEFADSDLPAQLAAAAAAKRKKQLLSQKLNPRKTFNHIDYVFYGISKKDFLWK